MEPPSTDDDVSQVEEEIRLDYECARSYFRGGDHIKAMAITEESISLHRKNNNVFTAMLHSLQGHIFSKLASETADNYVKCAYLFSAVESHSQSTLLFPRSLEFFYSYASSLFYLGEQLASKEYYEKAVNKANEALAIDNPADMLEDCIYLSSDSDEGLSHEERIKIVKDDLGHLIKLAGMRLDPSTEILVSEFTKTVKEKNSRPQRKIEKGMNRNLTAVAEEMSSFWAGMSVKDKRDFLKVNIEKFTHYVEGIYGKEGKEALERGLEFAKTSKKWKLWKCGTCSKEFHRSSECKKHLQQEHATRFRPSSKDIVPKSVDDDWAEMVCDRDWKPGDTKAAVELLTNQIAAVKQFIYVNGWSTDWPSANDEDRSNLLKIIRQSLELLHKRKCLPISIQDRFLALAYKQFDLLGVPRQHLEECRLPNLPQCICFFETPQLKLVQQFLERLETDVSTDLLSKGVDVFWEGSRIKERIKFDDEFSHLLLDKRLLRGKIDNFDEEGTVEVCASGDNYSRLTPQGNEIISWLLDCPQIQGEFKFYRPIREHNLGIWLAVSRIVESKCKALERKYHKRLLVHSYGAALLKVKEICEKEDEGRMNIAADEWDAYASVLSKKCDELVMEDSEFSHPTVMFLSAVRDVLEGMCGPRFGCFDAQEYLTCISELADLHDDFVSGSMDVLFTALSDKIPLIDSKILMTDNSRNQLLNDLTRLSVFDYRSFIIPLLKCYLREELDELIEMDARARSAEAAASLLSDIEREDEKKKKSLLQKKKKKDKRSRRSEVANKEEISTSASSPLDQEAEPEASLTCESAKIAEPFSESEKTAEPVKAKEAEHIEHVSSEEEVNIAEADASHVDPEDESRASEQLKDSSKSDCQKEETTMAKPIIEEKQTMPKSESLENKEISNTKNISQPEEASSSIQLTSAPAEDEIVYDSALDMLLKSLWCLKVFREELACCLQSEHNHLEDQCVLCALRDVFSVFSSKQINEEGLYHYLLNDLCIALKRSHPNATGSAELLIAILEFLHSWKTLRRESLVTSTFTLEEFERMSCNRCRRKPNYPEESSYGLVISASSLREFKFAFKKMKFEEILKSIRMNFKMSCDAKTGGCGKRNYVLHVLKKFPTIFTIALEWENNETEEQIYATMMALDTEIDMSVLYEGVNQMTKFHLVSMVGVSEGEHICLACENGRWGVYDPSVKEEIGSWKNVTKFCGGRKIRPEILFLQASWWPKKL